MRIARIRTHLLNYEMPAQYRRGSSMGEVRTIGGMASEHETAAAARTHRGSPGASARPEPPEARRYWAPASAGSATSAR